QSYSPEMSNLRHHVAFDKGDFIGRDAALRQREKGVDKVLVTLRIDAKDAGLRSGEKGVDKVLVPRRIDAKDADASGFEPVKRDGKLVGFVTSGAYGHHVGQTLALGYVGKHPVGTRRTL